MVRKFRKLRLSLNDTCNFACVYCVTGQEPSKASVQTPIDDFVRWVKAINKVNALSEIRLTGGEPTLYRQLVPLVARLKTISDMKVSLTTNGFSLATLAGPLREAGLDAVNISLDALDENVFRQMGGRSPSAVFAGIDAALAAGLDTKINTTLVSEMNDLQILPLLGWARAKNITIRFLELMAMGHLHGEKSARLVAAEQILSVVATAFDFRALPRSPHATAHYYELEGGYRFGIIGNTSLPFCSDCDRLRLDSKGRIYGCLSSPKSYAIEGSGADTSMLLEAAMRQKQAERFTGSQLVMREIGG